MAFYRLNQAINIVNLGIEPFLDRLIWKEKIDWLPLFKGKWGKIMNGCKWILANFS